MVSVFSCSTMLTIDLFCLAFIMLKYVPSILSFTRAFILKGCWILILFLHLLRKLCEFFALWFCLHAILHLFICVFISPCNEMTWWCNPFNVLLIQVSSIFVRIFVCSSRKFVYIFFFVVSLFSFGIRVLLDS
jgi:hypothetical protein